MVTCPAYFGDRSFQENESPQMSLTRLNDSAFDAQLEGVYFGMWNGSTPVRCFVSHEAFKRGSKPRAGSQRLKARRFSK